MAITLYGLEAEILLKLASDEPIVSTSKPIRDAHKRLIEKGLVENNELTEKGKTEARWRKEIMEQVRDVYDLNPGGGYLREIHFVYEPITAYSYAWNWCGLHGVSILKTEPRKGTMFFEAAESNFWIEGNQLSAEDLSFKLPTNKITQTWDKGETIPLTAKEIWDINDFYFRFFLDFKEDCYYTGLNLAAFQTWLIMDERHFNSCFFVAVTGAYGGGKSVSCEALVFLGRHGKVADPSVAFLGRSMERLGLTVFMDEFDIVEEANPELGRLARRCQRRGQTYDRSTKSGKTQSFKVFGVWIISIHGVLEDALATRTIPITIEETGNPDVPVVNPEKTRLAQEIYDQMWMWYMDNIDHISHEIQREREFDLTLDAVLDGLIIDYHEDGTPFVTSFDQRAKIDGFDKQLMSNNILLYNSKSNISNLANKSKMGKNGIEALRRVVATSILSSCTDNQKKIIRKAAGRNIELMVTAFKIANIVNINRDENIERLFEIKRETEEEERQIGTIGHIRDLLADLYKKRKEHENYWSRDGFFMISNMELFNEINPFFHRREQAGITRREYNEALRELGFIRPTSRKKMAIKTWQEIEEGLDKTSVRLANVYTEAVQRKLNLATEKPDFGQKTMDGLMFQPQPTLQEEKNNGVIPNLQEKMEIVLKVLRGFDEAVTVEKILEKIDWDRDELMRILKILQRDNMILRPRSGYWTTG